jgi:hypothetical protein
MDLQVAKAQETALYLQGYLDRGELDTFVSILQQYDSRPQLLSAIPPIMISTALRAAIDRRREDLFAQIFVAFQTRPEIFFTVTSDIINEGLQLIVDQKFSTDGWLPFTLEFLSKNPGFLSAVSPKIIAEGMKVLLGKLNIDAFGLVLGYIKINPLLYKEAKALALLSGIAFTDERQLLLVPALDGRLLNERRRSEYVVASVKGDYSVAIGYSPMKMGSVSELLSLWTAVRKESTTRIFDAISLLVDLADASGKSTKRRKALVTALSDAQAVVTQHAVPLPEALQHRVAQYLRTVATAG